MKNRLLVLASATFLAFSSTVAAQPPAAASKAIRKVISEAYCNGAYNALDTTRMAQGFHPDFAILSAEGEALERYTISTWISAIEARKAKPDFVATSAVRQCRVASVEATDSVASAKVVITKAGKLQYTDYLLLINFKEGWKIVSKVYAEH